MLRTEYLLIDTSHIDVPFGCEARRIKQLIGIKTYLLAESTLGFFDGHAFRNADIDMTFATSRISLTQHHVVPLRHFILIHFQCFLESLTHQLGVVYIHTCHKGECLGNDTILCPMVVFECRVVRADEWQPVFLLLLTGTNVCDILAEPLLAEQLVELLSSLGLCISPIIFRLIGEMLCVQCYQSVYHMVSSFLDLK